MRPMGSGRARAGLFYMQLNLHIINDMQNFELTKRGQIYLLPVIF